MMCKKLVFLTTIVLMLAFIGSVSADPSTYTEGTVLLADVEGKEDGEGDEGTTQAGWTRIEEFWNLNVNGLGFDVQVQSHLLEATEGRTADYGGGSPPPPVQKYDVMWDLIFGNDTATPPDNDMLLKFMNLKPGYHRVFSYHVRSDEGDVPCAGIELSGDDLELVVSTPGFFIQDMNIMTIPAETIFKAKGEGGIVILRIKGPSESGAVGGEGSGQAYLNGFILEYFGATNKAPIDPSPAHRTENLCTWDVSPLTWTPGAGVASQSIYFSSEINDVDPNESPSATDTIGGTGSWVTPALSGGVTYYWRVDGGGVQGAIWKFSTNAGQAYNPVPANGWRGLPTDVDLEWSTGCGANDHRVYFGTSEVDVTNGTGGTDKGLTGGPANTTYEPGALTANTKYFWKIVSQTGGEISPIWRFKTGSGLESMLLHYSFDDGEVIGTSLPATLLDDTGNETFTLDVNDADPFPDAALEYGSSAIWGTVDSDESADFTPLAGLYRDGEAEGVDPLILDGYQYTIECWVNPDEISDPGGDQARDPGAILISMTGTNNDGDETIWALEVSEPAGAIFAHRGTDVDRQNMQIYSGRGSLRTGEWTHLAAVWDMSAADSAKIYVNGQLMGAAAKPYANPEDTNDVAISIGYSRNGDEDLAFEGLLDEIKVHNYALEVSEFGLVPDANYASGPDPANYERRVDPNADLSWSKGSEATDHRVYFGTSRADVLDGTGGTDQGLTGGPDANTFEPGTMDYGTSYYWRIDEIGGGGPYSGMIWKFTVQSVVDDPNRLLWYQFNETTGDEAEDASGHDLVGKIGGNNEWEWDPNDGDEGCLVFDDDIHVEIPVGALEQVYEEISIAVWLKDTERPGENNWLYDTEGSSLDIQIAVPDQNGMVYWRCGNDTTDVLIWNSIQDNINLNKLDDWHHWVFTKSESDPCMSIYFDGEVAESNNTVSESFVYMRGLSSKIGATGGNDSDLVAKVDDFIIFDYVLSDSDIISLYRRGDLAVAWKPDPRNSGTDVIRDANLGWNPGNYALTHDVYFGTDFDDVNDANTLDIVFKQNQSETTYDPCDNYTLGNTYYWRIDEVNDPCVWKGKVWKFTAANYLIVDDFEDYVSFGHSNPIHSTWQNDFDTGAWVELGFEPLPVHRGDQSMEYGYDSDYPDAEKYSENYRNYANAQNWEEADVKLLTLFFYGHPDNDANSTEQMYFGIQDSNGTESYSEVRYGDYGEDMNDIRLAEWTEWNMDLADFNATLTDVRKLFLGFGDREAPSAGGMGYVYFDDVRLYPPKCVPAFGPLYDFGPDDGDCIVGLWEIAELGEDWLKRDRDITPVEEPNDPVLHYRFDESSGFVINDSAGSYHATFIEDVNRDSNDITNHMDSDSMSGNSFHFSADTDDVNEGGIWIPKEVFTDNGISQEITVAVWIKNAYTGEDPEGDTYMWDFRQWDGSDPNVGEQVLAVKVEDDGEKYVLQDSNSSETVSYELPMDWEDHTEWTHYTFVRDANYLKIYVNGYLEESSDSNGTAMAAPGLMYLGVSSDKVPFNADSDNLHDFFTGNMDDFMIFDYALSKKEAGFIGTIGGLGYIAMPPATMNISDDEATGSRVVNFKDYAKLMLYWLDEELWP